MMERLEKALEGSVMKNYNPIHNRFMRLALYTTSAIVAPLCSCDGNSKLTLTRRRVRRDG